MVETTALEPDMEYYSVISLLLDSSYDELTEIFSTCFSQRTANRFSEDHVCIIIDLLVDDSGKVIEASQQIYSDTIINDKSTLYSLADLDRTINEEFRFNDDGRFLRYGIPYGWTRLSIRFIDGKGIVSGLAHQHP